MGARGTRWRPPHLAVGRRAAATGARAVPRSDRHTPGRRAALRGGAVRPPRPRGQRLGVDGEPPAAVPLRRRRRPRGRRRRASVSSAAVRSSTAGRDALLVPARDAAGHRRSLRRLPARRGRRASPPTGSSWSTSPRGRSSLGSDRAPSRGPAPPDEVPRHTVDVAAFELSATPVTNEQYAAFVRATGAAPIHWDDGAVPEERRAPSRDPRRLARRDGVLRLGRAGGSRPRPSGRRAPAALTGASTPGVTRRRPGRAHAGDGLKHGATTAVGAARTARRRTVSSTWPGTSGSGSRARTGRTRTTPATAARIPRERRVARAARRLVREPHARAPPVRPAERESSGRRSAHIGFRVARPVGRQRRANERPGGRRPAPRPDPRAGRDRGARPATPPPWRAGTRTSCARSASRSRCWTSGFRRRPSWSGGSGERARADDRAQRAPRHRPDPARRRLEWRTGASWAVGAPT